MKNNKNHIKASVDPTGASAALSAISGVIVAAKDYMVVREQETTKRKVIAAELKAKLHQIDAQKEVVLDALSKRHEERMKLLEILQQTMQHATMAGDREIVIACLGHLQLIATQSNSVALKSFHKIEE